MRVRFWAAAAAASVLAAGCGSESADYEARGTVEVHESELSAPSPARVVRLSVDEGDQVEAGDTIAVLTQADLGATLEAQRARLASAQANLRDLEAGSRTQEIRQAEAEVAGATAEAERTAKDLERMQALAAENAIARQQLDNAQGAARVAAERRRAAEEALALVRAGARPQRIAGARSEVATARAALEQVEARAGDLVLTAPVSGIILGRHAEPGEMLGANVSVATLGETGKPYVRVYLPQRVIRTLKVGDAVTIVNGAETMGGRVTAINPRAEFTPRVALTESEREDLMFGVRVEPERPIFPGLWVIVRIPGQAGVQRPPEGR
jgi:HlyD family secretion protein